MYSIMTMVHLKVAKRENFTMSHHKEKKKEKKMVRSR